MILEATRIHMPNLVEHVLLGDIGATNARFALLSNGKLNAINSFEVAKFGQFTNVVANFVEKYCAHHDQARSSHVLKLLPGRNSSALARQSKAQRSDEGGSIGEPDNNKTPQRQRPRQRVPRVY